MKSGSWQLVLICISKRRGLNFPLLRGETVASKVISAILTLKDKDFSSNMKKAASGLNDFERKLVHSKNGLNQFGNSAKTSFLSVVKSAGGAALAIGGIAGAVTSVGVAISSINKAMDFEAQLSSIKALTGATNQEMKSMSDLAMKMGAQTKYSALEAAQGIEELLKAGLTPAQVESGGLEAALNLATAGGLELVLSAEIMSTALNAYKSDAMSAADASNILAGTANASATSVEELQYGLAQVSAVASGVGMSFKDTNVALGLFANNGLKGSDGGTSLKTMLSNLSPMTKSAAAEMKGLGLMTAKGTSAFYDAKGNMKSLEEIAGLLQTSLKDLNAEQRQQSLYTMFGSDAIRAATILFKEGAEGVRKFTGEMSKVTALDVAREKMNNAKGAIEQFKGAMETLQIGVMTPLLPLIKDAANGLADFVGGLNPEQIEAFGARVKDTLKDIYDIGSATSNFFRDNWGLIGPIIYGVAAAVTAYKVGVIGMAAATNIWKVATGSMTIAQALLNGVLAITPLGWIAIAIGVVVAAGVALYRNWDTVKEKTIQLWNTISEKFPGIKTAITTAISPILILFSGLKDKWDSFKSSISNFKMPSFGLPKVLGGKGLIQPQGSFAVGIDRVPYDMVAQIHKDEMIIPARQSNELRSAGIGINNIAQEREITRIVTNSSQPVFNITINAANNTVNEIANELVPLLKSRLANM